MVAGEMVWDLSQLVESTDLVAIQRALGSMVAEAGEVREQYHGRIGSLDAKGVLGLLDLRDAFALRFEGVVNYCNNMYSADSTSDVAKQLNEAVRGATMTTYQALAFIDLELGKLLASKPSLVDDSVLGEFRHYLERLLRRVPHMLSEVEEQLVIMKDKNGVRAWELLQSDWLSTRTFTIEIDGVVKTLPYGQMVGLYQSPDRDLRKRAYQTVYEGLGKDDIVWASAVRAVCEDHVHMGEMRKMSSPMTQSLIDNDVDEQAIDSLMKTIEKNAGLYQRYLRLKAKLMGLPKLSNFDLVAPLPKSSSATFSWGDARKKITSVYGEFDGQFGEWIDEMYEKRHLDGAVRKGKTAGAWCNSWLAGKSAYILQSYNGRIMDVYTQAHELGHAIHSYLLSRSQKPSNCEVGSCMAEAASIFGELLLTERLLKEAKTPEEKQAILAVILDEFGGSAFQVSARVFFEQALYDSIKQGRSLDGETVARLWVESRTRISGDAIDWLEVMKWEWAKTPHYFLANYRFYNYPYVFAQLFVYALYRLYKEEGKDFTPKLKALLSTGSSKSPRELAAQFGYDITKEEFWQKGMKQAEEFMDMLEKTL
jgi:oligoendopeptidase F